MTLIGGSTGGHTIRCQRTGRTRSDGACMDACKKACSGAPEENIKSLAWSVNELGNIHHAPPEYPLHVLYRSWCRTHGLIPQ